MTAKTTTYTRKEMLRIFQTPTSELSPTERTYVLSGQLMKETWGLYYMTTKGKGEPDLPRWTRLEAWFYRGLLTITFGDLPYPPRLAAILKK